jgi:hypothetical protein
MALYKRNAELFSRSIMRNYWVFLLTANGAMAFKKQETPFSAAGRILSERRYSKKVRVYDIQEGQSERALFVIDATGLSNGVICHR